MEKAEFSQMCLGNLTADNHGLSAKILPTARRYLIDNNKGKLPVIWLETSDSGDNNIAFMNTTYPYLNQVFTDMIDLLYSNTFMAAQGSDALMLLENTISHYHGKFTLWSRGRYQLKPVASIMSSPGLWCKKINP